MTVIFTNLDEFLDDLKTEVEGTGQRIDDNIVRFTIEKKIINKTTIEFTVVAGFCSLGELRQYEETVGMDFIPNDDSGTSAAEKVYDVIKNFCALHGLMLRGGRFEVE